CTHDCNQVRARKCSEIAADGFAQLRLAKGYARRTEQRISVSQPRTEVGVFPGLDASMRQAEPAVCLDGFAPQAGHKGLARAGERIRGRLEHVEIALLP